MSDRPTPSERLSNPHAVLTRTDLRELGWERRAVDAIMLHCPTVHVPGYSRPVILVSEYLGWLEEHTYRGDRVRPIGMA
jgi:hypothetical protein